jgi:hypothetical protein
MTAKVKEELSPFAFLATLSLLSFSFSLDLYFRLFRQ